MGINNSYILPHELCEYLVDMDITTLAEARNSLPDAHKYWYTMEELGVGGSWKEAWNSFIRSLETCGLRLVDLPDALTWYYKRTGGLVTAKSIYDSIAIASSPQVGSRILDIVWNSPLPRKICCFI